MSPLTKIDNRWTINKSALLTYLVSLLIGGLVSGFGTYYAIKTDIQASLYRIDRLEVQEKEMQAKVDAHLLGYSGDQATINQLCSSLKELRATVEQLTVEVIKLRTGLGGKH